MFHFWSFSSDHHAFYTCLFLICADTTVQNSIQLDNVWYPLPQSLRHLCHNQEICWFWPPNGHDSFTMRQKCQRFSTKCVLFAQSNLIAVYLYVCTFFKSLKTILMVNYIILRHWAQHIMDDSWLATGLPGNQHDLPIQISKRNYKWQICPRIWIRGSADTVRR